MRHDRVAVSTRRGGCGVHVQGHGVSHRVGGPWRHGFDDEQIVTCIQPAGLEQAGRPPVARRRPRVEHRVSRSHDPSAGVGEREANRDRAVLHRASGDLCLHPDRLPGDETPSGRRRDLRADLLQHDGRSEQQVSARFDDLDGRDGQARLIVVSDCCHAQLMPSTRQGQFGGELERPPGRRRLHAQLVLIGKRSLIVERGEHDVERRGERSVGGGCQYGDRYGTLPAAREAWHRVHRQPQLSLRCAAQQRATQQAVIGR